jgi:hypothetical protein
MKVKLAAGAGLAVLALPLSAAVAHADANSYLDYLASHHIATGLNTPGFNVSAGLHACDMLHAGLSPQQVIASDPTAIGVDIPGVVDAAQHELCPDTLH